MSTPNQPQDPYSQPGGDGSGQQPGGAPGGIPQYGQYSSSDPAAGYGQPAGYGQQGYAAPPQNYLVFSILATVLCCIPLGIVSIVFASQVNTKWNAGDQAGALESARKAKQWAIWSVIGGVVFAILYGILIVAGVLSTDFSTY